MNCPFAATSDLNLEVNTFLRGRKESSSQFIKGTINHSPNDFISCVGKQERSFKLCLLKR